MQEMNTCYISNTISLLLEMDLFLTKLKRSEKLLQNYAWNKKNDEADERYQFYSIVVSRKQVM